MATPVGVDAEHERFMFDLHRDSMRRPLQNFVRNVARFQRLPAFLRERWGVSEELARHLAANQSYLSDRAQTLESLSFRKTEFNLLMTVCAANLRSALAVAYAMNNVSVGLRGRKYSQYYPTEAFRHDMRQISDGLAHRECVLDAIARMGRHKRPITKAEVDILLTHPDLIQP